MLLLSDVNIIILVDGILYMLFALYIEAVFPGEYGLPLPWYFPFTVSLSMSSMKLTVLVECNVCMYAII